MAYTFADTCLLSALLMSVYLSKYLEGDGKWEAIFMFDGLFEGTQCSPREYYCIGTNGAPTMVSHSRGFAALLKVFIVAKKVCIRSVNEIKAHHFNS